MAAGTLEGGVSTTTTTQSAILSKNSAWWFGVLGGHLQFYDWKVPAWHDSGVVVNDGLWHQGAVTFSSATTNGSQMYVHGKPAGAAFTMTITNPTAHHPNRPPLPTPQPRLNAAV